MNECKFDGHFSVIYSSTFTITNIKWSELERILCCPAFFSTCISHDTPDLVQQRRTTWRHIVDKTGRWDSNVRCTDRLPVAAVTSPTSRRSRISTTATCIPTMTTTMTAARSDTCRRRLEPVTATPSPAWNTRCRRHRLVLTIWTATISTSAVTMNIVRMLTTRWSHTMTYGVHGDWLFIPCKN